MPKSKADRRTRKYPKNEHDFSILLLILFFFQERQTKRSNGQRILKVSVELLMPRIVAYVPSTPTAYAHFGQAPHYNEGGVGLCRY